jgi:pectate lyase
MKKSILWIALAVVLIAGAGVGGYFLGMEDGKTQTSDARDRFIAERFGQTGQTGQPSFSGQMPQGGQQGSGGGMIVGGRGATFATIKEIQGSTLVVSTAEKEMNVVVGADTTISVTSRGSVSDLKVGDRITVAGETKDDTLNATMISLVPNLP